MSTPLKNNHTKIEQQLKNDVSLPSLTTEYGVSRQAVHEYVNKYFKELLKNKPCKECGNDLSHKRRRAKFCNLKCSNAFNNRQLRHEIVCAYCGKVEKKHDKRIKFCSLGCARSAGARIHPHKVLERYHAGETIKDIATSFDTTPGVIYGSLYRKGLKLRENAE